MEVAPPAGRCTLPAVQNKTILRGLEGMKFPMMMWLGYMIGSQRRRLIDVWEWMIDI